MALNSLKINKKISTLGGGCMLFRRFGRQQRRRGKKPTLKMQFKSGMCHHACNPNTQGAEAGESQAGHKPELQVTLSGKKIYS